MTLGRRATVDVAGYSRLMGSDEETTVAALDSRHAIFRDAIESRHGRVADTAGDIVLAVLESVVEAVEGAGEVRGHRWCAARTYSPRSDHAVVA